MGTNSFPTTGVRLTADGSADYIRQIQKATDATRGLQSSLPQTGASALAAAGQVKNLGFAATSAAVALGIGLYQAAEKAYQQLKNIGKLAEPAMRFQELTMVAKLLGQQQGYTADQIDGFIAKVRKSGIEAGVAATAVQQFARYNIDMAKAVDLAKVAQDSAVIAGQNSSQTMDRLIYGIITQQSEVLRTAGINVQFANSFDEVAKAAGKSTQELTSAERVNAALNAVLAEGTKIAGAYQIAMETPGKQIRSLARYIDDIAVSLGTPFLATIGSVVKSITHMVKGFSALISEGGRLYPIIMQLGGATAFIADGLGKMANNGIDQVLRFIGEAGVSFGNFVAKAFEWGFNISAELGLGIARGATEVITAAIAQISQLLTFWLSPGSPPRVAPNIDEWGTQAMAQFLGGFSEVDYGILDSVQGTLQNALSLLTSSGDITSQVSSDTFANMSENLIQGLSSGNISAVLADIRNTFGPLSEDIAQLTIKEFELAQAGLAVEKIEKRLLALSEKHEKAVETMNTAQDEYNALARSGASREVLDAKRAEFYAAKDTADATEQEMEAQGQKYNKAKRNQTQLEKELKLQQKLVAQLIELAKARIEAAKVPETGGLGGGAGGLGGGLPAVPPFDFDFDALKDQLGKKVEEMKKVFAEKIKGLFAPFEQEWLDVQVAFLWMEADWLVFVKSLKTWWDTHTAPLVTAIEAFADETGIDIGKVGEFLGKASGNLLLWVTGMDRFILVFPLFTQGMTFMVTKLTELVKWTKKAGEETDKEDIKTRTMAYFVGGPFLFLMTAGIQHIEDMGDRLEKSGGWMSFFKSKAIEVAGYISIGFKKSIKGANVLLNEMWDVQVKIVEKIIEWVGEIPGLAAALLDDFGGAIDKVIEKLDNLIGQITSDDGLIKIMVGLGENLVRGLIDGLTGVWATEQLRIAITGFAANIPGWLKELLGVESPSKVMAKEIGEPIAAGVGKGILDGLPALEKSVSVLAKTASMRTGLAADAMAAGQRVQRSYATSIANTNQYNLNLSTRESRASVTQSFEVMRMLGRTA